MGGESKDKDHRDFSRREFLTGAGGFAATIAAGTILTSGGLGLFSKTRAAETPEAPPWPWPYTKLDPEVVAEKGYEGFYKGACCYGAASAILSELRQEVGYPFALIPMDMFRYGEGGIVGWSTLCGALNGASAVINLVSGAKVYPKLINELVGWYTQTPFPNYKPAGKQELAESVSGSPLCHVSVTNWCKASGYGAVSPERAERCARLVADVAAHAVQLLNHQADGVFLPAFAAPSTISECMSCHGKDSMNNTRGLMTCVQCHEPHST